MEWIVSVPVVLRWIVTLSVVAGIVALSVTPGLGERGSSVLVWLVDNTATSIQKVMHVTLYAVLAMLWVWTFESVSGPLRALLALLATVGIGALLEWRQTRVPGRYGTLSDVALNAGGAVAGLALAHLLVLLT